MKKYQQLLIVSLGLVSFICFLIYKHEYDRLRNVLEVLEVFGSPPSPQNGALRSDINHNNLGAGSINELNLGAQQNNNDDSFVLKNGHGVRPPDMNDDPVVVDDTKGNNNNAPQQQPNNKNVIHNPIQNSGEVIDNIIDDVGGVGDGVIGKFAGLKAKKQRQQQDSIFKEKQLKAND